MSSSPLLSQLSDDDRVGSGRKANQAFNLVVLVKERHSGTSARAANLAIPMVEAATVREALNALVQEAKKLIAQHLATGCEVPWIHPPDEAADSESRFLVPMHL